MKNDFCEENSNQLLFSTFDSTKPQKENSFRIHRHAELEIGYICSGEGEYILNEQRYDVRPGDIFLIPPNQQHCIPTIYTPSLVSFNFYVAPTYLGTACAEYIDPRLRQMLIERMDIPHRFEGKGEFVEQIKRLIDDAESNRFAIKYLFLSLIRSIADDLIPYLSETDVRQMTTAHFHDIANAINYINAHFTEPMAISDIARAARLGHSQLYISFHQATGMTPHDYLTHQRIKLAQTRLRDTNDTILDILHGCGFQSPSSFSKCFKRITGISPVEWRKTSRERNSGHEE